MALRSALSLVSAKARHASALKRNAVGSARRDNRACAHHTRAATEGLFLISFAQDLAGLKHRRSGPARRRSRSRLHSLAFQAWSDHPRRLSALPPSAVIRR